MTPAENGDQHLFDDIGLTHDDLSHLLFHPLIDSVELVYDFPVIFLTRGLKGHKAFTHAMTGSSSAVPSTTRPCFLAPEWCKPEMDDPAIGISPRHRPRILPGVRRHR